MKKTLSVLLAMLMVACLFTPALAAGTTYNVTFVGPSAELEADAYTYYYSTNGVFTEFEEDPDGNYVYYQEEGYPGQYYCLDDLTSSSRKIFEKAEPGSPESIRYSPAKCKNGAVAANKTVSFIVATSEKYDINSVVVLCNGAVVPKNANGEYAVTANRALRISVKEKDENNAPILLRTHFIVALTSGDGYAAKPLANNNNKAVYYGDDFEFRVRITKGFNGDNMKVKVIRGENFLSEFLGEDADMLSSVMGDAETLPSTGVDMDGYRTYKIKNITSDCKVLISGVNKESSSGVLAMLKRILRMLLGLLGINLDGLLGEGSNPLAAYTVSLQENISAYGVSYSVSPKLTFNSNSGKYETEVLNGEGVSIVVTKEKENQVVNVSWQYKDANGETVTVNNYAVSWQSFIDVKTNKTLWSAVWYIDGIGADTEITITAR